MSMMIMGIGLSAAGFFCQLVVLAFAEKYTMLGKGEFFTNQIEAIIITPVDDAALLQIKIEVIAGIGSFWFRHGFPP